MSVIESILNYKEIIIFYIVIFLLIYFNKEKFDIQARFIALYKTRIGLRLMEKLATKYRELFRLLGYIGVGVGFVAMVVIFFQLVSNLIKLVMVPGTTPGVGLVIPGVHIPGSPIFVPFWFGIISIFIVVVVHEFGHGIIAKAHDIKIKSSGFLMFGPLPGAFVEPDEKQLSKKSDITQYSVFAAGPFSNILLALLAMALFLWVFTPLQNIITEPIGISFESTVEGFPADLAGMKGGEIINSVNGKPVKDTAEFIDALRFVKPNETLVLGTEEKEYTIITTSNPEDPEAGYIGIKSIQSEVRLKEDTKLMNFLLAIILWLQDLFKWVFFLSLGIGLANLLPLGPVDGGRMFQTASLKLWKSEKKAMRIWKNVSIATLVILILTVFFPFFKWLGSLFIP